MNANVRNLAGRPVVERDGWVFVDETTLAGITWRAFARPEPTTPWVNVRVVAKGSAPHKANYWLGWNGERWAESHDSDALRAHRADLLAWLDSLALTHGFKPEPAAA